jgi:hypothetical protein
MTEEVINEEEITVAQPLEVARQCLRNSIQTLTLRSCTSMIAVALNAVAVAASRKKT